MAHADRVLAGACDPMLIRCCARCPSFRSAQQKSFWRAPADATAHNPVASPAFFAKHVRPFVEDAGLGKDMSGRWHPHPNVVLCSPARPDETKTKKTPT